MIFIPRKATNPQDLADTLQREAQAAKLAAELKNLLFNRAGLDRLRNVTDEEWRAAQSRDDDSNSD